MSPSTTGRCYQTREWGQPTNGSAARQHGDTAANHTDWLYIFCPGVVDRSVFAVQAGSNLWDLIWEPPSHYSMAQAHNVDNCARFHVFRDPALEDKCAHIKTYKYYFVHRRAAGATNGVTKPHYSPQPPPWLSSHCYSVIPAQGSA